MRMLKKFDVVRTFILAFTRTNEFENENLYHIKTNRKLNRLRNLKRRKKKNKFVD